MTNITQEVRDFLHKNPFIMKGLNTNIINLRALSFYIIKQMKMNASLHAVLSAVRRYKQENKKSIEKLSDNVIAENLRDSKLSTKSRLVMLTAKRDFKVLRNTIPEILDHIDTIKGEVLRFVEGRESIKFIIDHSKKQEIKKIIPLDQLLGVREDLGEVNVHLSEAFGDIPGLIATILNEIAINNINLIEAIGCTPELILIVEEKDISACHDVLLRFFYNKKNI